MKPPPLFSCFKTRGSSSSSSSSTSAAKPGSTATVSADDVPGEGPVLVELFTSQGCVTSPAAELLLSRLGRGDFDSQLGGGGASSATGAGAKVVVLGFHVDYWDYMGWKDPYGGSQWTVRQKAYVEALNLDTMFTPQVVVQGRAQCVGNEEEPLIQTIANAPRFPAPAFKASFQRPTTDTLQVTLTGPIRMKIDQEGADVMVALYEKGLVNDCPNGENKGRVLTNENVVRKLEKLCNVKDTSAKKAVSGTVSFSLWEGFNPTKCSLAVFVQNRSHQIFGTQNVLLPNDV